MNRHLLFFVLLLLAGASLQLFLPWWSWPVVVLVLVYVFRIRPPAAIGLAFLAGLCLWGGYAWWLDMGNEGILATRMGNLFNGIGRWGILGVTAIIGGIIGLLAGWTGSWASRLFATS